MQRLRTIIMTAIITLGLGVILIPSPANAINVFEECTASNKDSAVCKSKDDSAVDMVKIVINTLLTVLGMIAVVMIVIGGIRYTTANGDPSTLKMARETIIYSVVGLVVAIMAFAIVNFVVGSFIPPKT